jgi:hypothetical protein
MKSLIASTVLALGLLSSAASAAPVLDLGASPAPTVAEWCPPPKGH